METADLPGFRGAADEMNGAEKRPSFAVEASIAALHWLACGYGYGVTSADVRAAYTHTMRAAENAGRIDETRTRIQKSLTGQLAADFVTQALRDAHIGLRSG